MCDIRARTKQIEFHWTCKRCVYTPVDILSFNIFAKSYSCVVHFSWCSCTLGSAAARVACRRVRSRISHVLQGTAHSN